MCEETKVEAEFLAFVRDNGADTIAVRYDGIIEIVGGGEG